MKTSSLFCFALFILITSSALKAQQAAVASGGDIKGSTGSLSYTIGQIDYTSLQSPAGTMNLGVQQPYETIADEEDFQILVFPNPTKSAVKIRVINSHTADMQIELLDMLGRPLMTGKIETGETVIPLTSFSPATYILQVRIAQDIHTYKIIKTDNL